MKFVIICFLKNLFFIIKYEKKLLLLKNVLNPKRLWKLHVPHKVKYFLWHVCKNNIPVKILLRSRGVPTSIICPMCDEDIEYVRHIFVECQYAKGCWDCINRDINIAEVEDLSVWLLSKPGTETEVKLVQIAKILWGIWFARNKKVWDGNIISPSIAMEISTKTVSDWRAAQSMVQGWFKEIHKSLGIK